MQEPTKHPRGRQVPAEARHSKGGVLRCEVCDGPAGEVSLMKVEALGKSGYICRGGDCAGQRTKALAKLMAKVQQ